MVKVFQQTVYSFKAFKEAIDDYSAKASHYQGDVATAGDTEYMLYLGTNDKDTNKPVYSCEESKERAKAILMKNFGGYTVQEAEGGWKSDDDTEYQHL